MVFLNFSKQNIGTPYWPQKVFSKDDWPMEHQDLGNHILIYSLCRKGN